MYNYQLTIIFAPEDEKKTEESVASLTRGVKVLKQEKQGRKTLAYPINKQTDGLYYYLELAMEPEEAQRILRLTRTDESILRHLLIKTHAIEAVPQTEEKKPAKIVRKKKATSK